MTPDDLLRAAKKNGLVAESRGVNLDILPEVELDDSSERAFQACVIEYAHRRGWTVAHFRPALRRFKGEIKYITPVAADGKGFFDLELARERLVKVELKVPPNKPTPDQLRWADVYEKAKIEWYIWKPDQWDFILTTLR